MAKIYISYKHEDLETVRRISEDLRNRGHETIMDESVLKVGQDWRKVLLSSLKEADGVLVLITERSLESKYVISEIGTARAYVAESDNEKFIIPVIYGNIPIPSFIEDLYCIRLDEGNFIEALNKIDSSISGFIARKQAAHENLVKEKAKVEGSAAGFIKDATEALKIRERVNSLIAYLCYLFGGGALVWGVRIGVTGFNKLNDIQLYLDKHPNQIWAIYIMAILKSAIVIGLLIAASKYAFTLGKSFMHESLRNADRIHAISFGEFYLKAYGDRVGSHAEIKEIFKDWNIDKPSSFSSLDTNTYDPKFTEGLLDVIKTLSDKVKKPD
jgi:hypothetical protein